jgi:hypothetical protein
VSGFRGLDRVGRDSKLFSRRSWSMYYLGIESKNIEKLKTRFYRMIFFLKVATFKEISSDACKLRCCTGSEKPPTFHEIAVHQDLFQR